MDAFKKKTYSNRNEHPNCQGFSAPCNCIGERRRLNSMYANEESNWGIFCDSCYKEGIEHYQEMLDDYYRMVM